MTPDELRARSRLFALDLIRFCSALPNNELTRVVRPQLIRSSTGTAANYRAACRARSKREFAARLGIVVEEADETELWLDLLQEEHYGPADRLRKARAEAIELRAIFSASRRTALTRLRRAKLARKRRQRASADAEA